MSNETLIKDAVSEALAASKDAIKSEVKTEVKTEVGELIKELMASAQEGKKDAMSDGWVSTPDHAKHYVPCKNFEDMGVRQARIIRSFYACGKDWNEVPKFISDSLHDKSTAVYLEKSLSTQNPASGGVLKTDQILWEEFIPYLRARSWLTQAGARLINMPSGSIMIPGMSTGTSSSWVGEMKKAQTTTAKFRTVKLDAKKAMGVIAISNDLLSVADVEVDRMIRDDLVRAYNETLHFAALKGPNNSKYTPRGLKHDEGCGVITWGALPNTDLLAEFEEKMHEADIEFNPTENAYIMGPRLYKLFWNLKDNYGRHHYREELRMRSESAPFGYIDGSRVFVYSKLKPGTDNNEKVEIYGGKWSEFLVGVEKQAEVTEHTEASFLNEAGDVVSGPQVDATALRVLGKADMAMRQVGALNRSEDVWSKSSG